VGIWIWAPAEAEALSGEPADSEVGVEPAVGWSVEPVMFFQHHFAFALEKVPVKRVASIPLPLITSMFAVYSRTPSWRRWRVWRI
jgi:hypothetical protein